MCHSIQGIRSSRSCSVHRCRARCRILEVKGLYSEEVGSSLALFNFPSVLRLGPRYVSGFYLSKLCASNQRTEKVAVINDSKVSSR